MKTISTFNAFHLGDNLLHLHFMRKVALENPEVRFLHACAEKHLPQLFPLIDGVANLSIDSLNNLPHSTNPIDSWRGADGWFYRQPDRDDFVAIHLRWFRRLADLMGVHCPIHAGSDLQFDYPLLERKDDFETADILVINSPPLSGQAQGYNHETFDVLIGMLRRAGHVVAATARTAAANFCTLDQGMSVTDIGRLSQVTRAVVGVATGPMWTTMNIWNRESVELRLWLLDSERVEISPNTAHANSLALFPEILKARGLL